MLKNFMASSFFTLAICLLYKGGIFAGILGKLKYSIKKFLEESFLFLK
jgi:hypothetical protein